MKSAYGTNEVASRILLSNKNNLPEKCVLKPEMEYLRDALNVSVPNLFYLFWESLKNIFCEPIEEFLQFKPIAANHITFNNTFEDQKNRVDTVGEDLLNNN
jgi:hypothetical protein